MSPTLNDGDYLITIKPRTLRSGLIYIVDHSDLGIIVKRLNRESHAGRYTLSSDNASATPDAILGSVEEHRFKRRAIAKIGRSGFSLL